MDMLSGSLVEQDSAAVRRAWILETKLERTLEICMQKTGSKRGTNIHAYGQKAGLRKARSLLKQGFFALLWVGGGDPHQAGNPYTSFLNLCGVLVFLL